MKYKPIVSIIINNYNYARFLGEAINSALAQTYPHKEVIVVDDGSTDNSRDVITSYGDQIIAIFQTNGKQGKAFNTGFAASKGEIIIFLDADDYLYPYAVKRIVGMWEPKFAKVHYHLNVVDASGESRGFSYPQGNQPLSIGEVWKSVISVGVYIGTPTSGNALSRKAMENVFPIPDEFNTTSDDYLSVLIPLYGEVGAIQESLGAYRIHTTNQWALTTVSAERIRRFVRHDLQRCALLQQKATELGYEVPSDLNIRFFGRVWSRLASLKLEPQEHLVKSDRSIVLMYWGIRALWKYSTYNWQKRIIFSLWFIWVALMPLPLAKPAIDWLLAPHFRPKIIAQILSTIRLLISKRVVVKS